MSETMKTIKKMIEIMFRDIPLGVYIILFIFISGCILYAVVWLLSLPFCYFLGSEKGMEVFAIVLIIVGIATQIFYSINRVYKKAKKELEE